MTRTFAQRDKQAGVGLIEVLIAVLVLSIGFLGMAALQTKALSNNNSAMMRTQAVVASYTILDAMRVDRAAALAGGYNTTMTFGTNGQCTASPSVSGLANTQLQEWCEGVGSGNATTGLAGLGAGTTGGVNCDNRGVCVVTITFDDDKSTGGDSAEQLVTRARI